MSINRAVMVLNSGYVPVGICSVKNAFKLVLKGRCVVEENATAVLRTSRLELPIPSVIRAIYYHKVPKNSHAISRKGVFLRDRLTCQYCGVKFQVGDLTLDHVIPRSRGGEHSWRNLVSSCFKCNNVKGNRTPEEAGMKLLHKPYPVGIHAKNRLLAPDNEGIWEKFMFV